MVKRLKVRLTCLLALCSVAAAAQQAPLEKHYRQAAWAFYLQQPAQALEALQLASQHDQRTQLLEAGLYLQLSMPQHAALVLQPLVNENNTAALPQSLLNIALLQFARHQLELGNKNEAKQYLSRVDIAADQSWLGQQQLLAQLLNWPQINIPAKPEFAALQRQAEMPYIISNQALAVAEQQPQLALQWLDSLRQQLQLPLQQSFWQVLFSGQWQLLFSGQWHLVSRPQGFVYAEDEYQALHDYLQLMQAQLHIGQQDFAAADAILSDFAANSVLSPAALSLYSHILTEQRHIPTLLSVLQQQINLQPFSSIAWQAATRIGAQLERALQQKDALAAYRWADQYYRQQRQLIEQQASPLQVSQLEQGMSDWQQLQLSQHDALHRLQQDILALQQQLRQAPTRQQRLNQLEQVTAYKITQQASLLSRQLPQLQARRQALQQQAAELKQQITQAEAQPLSLLLADGALYQQLSVLHKAEQRLAQLSGANAALATADYQSRLTKLRGILHWQYYDSAASRKLQRQRALSALDSAMQNMDDKLAMLQQQSLKAARLEQINQRLGQLNIKQQQLNLALLSQQQRLLAQLNQQLQQRRQQDLATLADLQRFNKEAMARVMERVLLLAGPTTSGASND